ncbi:hypothetical protein SAMN05421819_0054 [Bryocella elongata]|uniref:Uncharacterized protein n=1 Tax=Bryocella elongata TaxID=863522 RepID=A0A1H5S323_9BACT|nr:hypothetical protein [Bryocella elongata]SEF44880.1 hypothetical protein SAMN05421819_0054 [Bryocella elongata]
MTGLYNWLRERAFSLRHEVREESSSSSMRREVTVYEHQRRITMPRGTAPADAFCPWCGQALPPPEPPPAPAPDESTTGPRRIK